MKRRTLFFNNVKVAVILALLSTPLVGQDVQVNVRTDSSQIRIGEWFTLMVEVSYPKGSTVLFPSFQDSVGPFEIIRRDTVKHAESDGREIASTSVTLTKYEPGFFLLPPISVAYRTPDDTALKTASSSMLSVSVSSVAIDTTAAERDIKPPLSVPWSWQEIAVIIGIILGISGLIYLIYRYRKKKWLEQDVMGVEMPKTPPHILAIDRLRELDLKRLWQQGRVKEFYSEATEIIRQYFEQRYGFLALEMTSDEILEELSKHDIQDAVVAMASGMLRKADLVKFAKHLPVAAENEEIVPKGLDIVEKSKPVIMLDDHV